MKYPADMQNLHRAERMLGYLATAAAEAEMIGDDKCRKSIERLTATARRLVGRLRRDAALGPSKAA